MAKRGNNEGSIYQRKDGRWVGVVTIGGGRGAQQRKNVYGKTRQTVAKKMTDTLKAVQDNVPLTSDQLTVDAFVKDWLASVKPLIRYKTYEGYEVVLRIHVLPSIGKVRLTKLTPLHLQRMYTQWGDRGLSPKSVRVYHSSVHSMLDKAVRLGLVGLM